MRDWVAFVRERVELPTMGRNRDDRAIRELADHLEDLHRDALVRGLSHEQADALVEEELSEQGRIRQELLAAEPDRARARTDRWLGRREDGLRTSGTAGGWLADRVAGMRRTFRSLVRQPMFAGTSVLVLSVGMGATMAIFALLDTIVLRPLPFEESDRLVSLSHRAPSRGMDDVGQCAAWHLTYQEHGRTFESVAMFSDGSVSVTGVGSPEALPVLFATRELLATLGLAPVAGRGFAPEEMDPLAPGTVMLTEGYWVSRFGADPTVVGRTLTVNGESREIVGVAPAALDGLDIDAELVLPLRFSPESVRAAMNIGYGGVARLREGATLDDAVADVSRMLPMSWELYPQPGDSDPEEALAFHPLIEPLQDRVVGSTGGLLWLLFGGVVVVLLMSCVNVATLVMIRADGRGPEMAVRTALGAGRRSVRWEYFKESLTLGALGAVAGLLLATVALQYLPALAPDELPRIDGVRVGGPVIALATAVTLMVGILFGALSMRVNTRAGLATVLRSGARGTLSRGRGAVGLAGLASVQLALAIVLAIGAGLLVRSMEHLASLDAGFDDRASFQVLRVSVPPGEIRDIEEAAGALDAIAQRLAELPGVTAVGSSTAIPLAGGRNFNPFVADGLPGANDADVMHRHQWVGGGYFDAMGIEVIAGRGLTWDDARSRMPVAVLSESLAIRYWGSAEAALGARVAARPEPVRWHEVVGVVADVRGDGLSLDAPALVYWPQVTLGFWEGTSLDYPQTWRGMTYAVRSDRAATAPTAGDLEAAVWSVLPTVPVRWAGTMEELRASSVARMSFATTLLGVAAAIAVLLGLVGVYGVVGYVVRMQTREFGLRIALGASGGDVRRLVLTRGMWITLVGVVAGVSLASLLSRSLEELLFGVEPSDPLTIVLVPLALALAAALAALVPARRAARADPMQVIRSE